MPTVRQLEYLVAIADVRHFRKAAEQVNTTQPTLSGQLKALEERLGVELVERSRSRVVMTTAGAEIADIARRVLRDVREIRAVGTAHNKTLAGIVRLGVPQSIGPSLVPRFAQDLRRQYPDLKFFVREENPLLLPNGLADGTYDIVIGPLPFAGGEFDTLELYREPLLLAVASNHELARHTTMALEDMKRLEIISMDPTHPLAVMVRHYCQDAGIPLLAGYTGNSLDTLREMVATGLGSTFLPALFVKAQLNKDKAVKVFDVPGRPLVRSVGIAWRKSGAVKNRFAELAQFLKATSEKVVGPL